LSETLADRTDGPPDVILVIPPAAETPLAASPPAEAVPAETAMAQAAPTVAAAIEVSPETARLDQEAVELADEASGLQSRAEGLQVIAHTSDPEPEAAAAQAEALASEAEALAAKAEAIADPAETLDAPRARPARVASACRAMGGALIATADAVDAVAEVIQRKGIASQPEAPHEHPPDAPHEHPLETPPAEHTAADADAEGMFDQAFEMESEETPVAELESDLAAALGLDEHHDQKPQDDETVSLELIEPTPEDEAPLPMSDAEPLFAEEPAAAEPAAEEPPAAGPTAAEPPVGEPVATEPATPAESPIVDASPLLLKAANLLSKAEAMRARGHDLLAKADALTVAAGAAGEEFEEGEGGQEEEGGEYAFHGDWAPAGLGQAAGVAAGQSAGVATAPGGAALPFPVTPRKQKKPKSAVREAISIVAGGVTAFVLTYLVLNMFSDQYEFGIWPTGWRHRWQSGATAQPASDTSSKAPKAAKPGQPNAAKSPAAHGQGTQVAQAGAEKPAAGKSAPLTSLPELKPGAPNSPPGETVPTTLASEDTLPGAMISPLKPEVPEAKQPAAPEPKSEEPKTEEKPGEPESQPPSADAAKFGKVVDMLKPPAYGSDDLGWALKSAQDAFKGDVKPEVYPQLCRLAEVLTFVDPQKGVTDLPARKAAAEKLLRDVGERDKHKNVMAIAQLAPKWLDNPDRGNPGILLAGRIQKIGQNSQGRTIAVIALAKPDKSSPTERTIKMVSQEPLDLQEKDAVIILGGLGVGGQGDHKELVVVHGMTVKFAVPPPKAK
jgi:hypothetical protein